jgi:hypothetical protein
MKGGDLMPSNKMIDTKLTLIRRYVKKLRYANQDDGGISIHPTDKQNFGKAMDEIDNAARELAIMLNAEGEV